MAADGIVERARDLAPLIASGRDHSEEQRHVRPDVVDACRQAGLFGLGAPTEVGGPEATLVESLEVAEIVGAADPSVAWYVNNSGACARAAAWLDAAWWNDLYGRLGPFGYGASPTGRLSPNGSDGYILDGTWPLMTGVLDAEWASVMCLLQRPDEPPVPRQAIVPTSAMEVNRIWDNAVAMRGTGSHEVSVAGHVVPTDLVIDPARTPPRIDRTLYRCPRLATVIPVGAGMAVGMLRTAVEAAAGEMRNKVSSTFGQRASENTALLDLMGDAGSTVEHLHYGFSGVYAAVWDHVESGQEVPRSLRAAAVAAPWRAVELARDLISRMYGNSSRAAYFAGHPLERSLRDMHAMVYGWNTIRPLYHDVGRVTLGHDPVMPGF